jgi:hypothetical protein
MSKPFAHASFPGSQQPDLASIAAMLNEAAQALLRFGKGQESSESGDSASLDDESEPSGPIYHLVNRVYDDLFTTILLMRHLDDSTEISGFELHLISDNLSRPLEVLSSVCSQLADFELVQKITVPA